MTLKKQYLKSKPECTVTFVLPKEIANGAKKVVLIGDFNDWDSKGIKLTKKKDGSFSKQVNLPVGNEYAYRYLIDGEKWENDGLADYYVASPISNEENGVVVIQ